MDLRWINLNAVYKEISITAWHKYIVMSSINVSCCYYHCYYYCYENHPFTYHETSKRYIIREGFPRWILSYWWVLGLLWKDTTLKSKHHTTAVMTSHSINSSFFPLWSVIGKFWLYQKYFMVAPLFWYVTEGPPLI